MWMRIQCACTEKWNHKLLTLQDPISLPSACGRIIPYISKFTKVDGEIFRAFCAVIKQNCMLGV